MCAAFGDGEGGGSVRWYHRVINPLSDRLYCLLVLATLHTYTMGMATPFIKLSWCERRGKISTMGAGESARTYYLVHLLLR